MWMSTKTMGLCRPNVASTRSRWGGAPPQRFAILIRDPNLLPGAQVAVCLCNLRREQGRCLHVSLDVLGGIL